MEKDINLSIALKLQSYLEQGGSFVLMTRIEDEALGDRKNSDLNQRKDLANLSKADIMVSIHQNSYSSGEVKGAQVFYYNTSDDSRRLAESIQNQLKGFADLGNKREAKANESYYVLKQTKIPSVIVECGFLSNETEKEKLANEEYQEKIAWSIYMGIVKYYADEEAPSLALSQH